VAFLRSPATVARAKDARFAGFTALQEAGSATLMNTGLQVMCAGGKPDPICTGKPDGLTETNPATRRLKVRLAVAAAVDASVVNTRAYEGKAHAGTELFQKDYPYYPNVAGLKFDLDTAKRLVNEAKSEGWNGRLRYLCNNSPTGQALALAYETLLKAAGIDVVVDVTKDVAAQFNQYAVLRDFDLTCAGLPLSNDGNAYATMLQQFTPGGPNNRTGWNNTIVGNAVRAFGTATTDDAKKAALKTISEQYLKDAPFVVDASVEQFVAYGPKIRGLVATSGSEIFFDKAWIEG